MRGLIIRRGMPAARVLARCFPGLAILALAISALAISALAILMIGGRPAAALPLSEFGRVYPYLVRKAQICLLTSIPTQANPIRDAALLAEVRRRLPDTFACGRCRYDLAGDQRAAYYLRTCR